MSDPLDLSNDYVERVAARQRSSAVREMEEWLDSNAVTGGMQSPEEQTPAPRRNIPDKPLRRPTDDPLGRRGIARSGVKVDPGSEIRRIGQHIAEVPSQIVAGIDDAARNALSIFDPIANWLNENVADLRYEPFAKPKTVTGSITRGVSEFLTGFIPALRGLRAIGMTGNVVPPLVAAAIADFTVRSPTEGRLIDLWNQLGLPKNVLTDYLSSNPDDTEIEARFKNVIEGLGLGLAAEGIFVGARALRNARSHPGVRQEEQKILAERYGTVSEEQVGRSEKGVESGMTPDVAKSIDNNLNERLGRPDEPVMSKPDVRRAARNVKKAMDEAPKFEPRALIRARKGEPFPEDWAVYINFNRIDEPDQVKFVIGKMAEAAKGQIDEARRGVIAQEETERLADELGFTVTDLLARRRGQPFNAEEAVAARKLWAASGEKLLELAKKAASPEASALDLYMFRKHMAVHNAIQKEVIGARTETARALASWKIDVKGGVERARAIEQLLNATGGADTAKDLAKRLAILADTGVHPAIIARYVDKGWGAKASDIVKEVWVNGLLTSPKTHIVNVTSNILVMFQQIYERLAAGAIRTVLGGDGVRMGEAAAMAYGVIESVKDAFRLAARALRTGETTYAFNKLDLPHQHALSSDALGVMDNGLARAVDFIGNVTRIPGRLLTAEDEFFKTIAYRMELRAQALRQATQEGYKGADAARRIQELLENPPEHMRINVADAAMYSTFTSDMGWFGRKVMEFRNVDSTMGSLATTIVLPFVRTPVNIARYAFERTPFAPLVAQWRADIAAGGARRDLALARMATGTAIMLVALDLADSGLVSGMGPRAKDKEIGEALRRQGWQPYSVKIGDRWYSYNRTDPFGMTMGFAADIAEAIRRGEINEDDVDEWQEVVAMAIAAVSQVTINKTYLEGFANFIEVVSDPSRYSEKYISDLVASFLPATSMMKAVKDMVDPVQREIGSPADAVRARIAGLSDRLPPRRDLWGRPVVSESGLGKIYDLVSPIQSREQVVSPVDRELVRLNYSPERISKRTMFDGTMVNMRFYPEVYDEYVRLAGNDLKHPAWGMGAKDFLDAVVDGKHPMSAIYSVMSDESRKEFIRGTISEYRRLAQQAIMRDGRFKDFITEVERLKQINRDARLPVLSGE